MLYKVTEWFGYNYIMEKKAFNIWMLIIWISDPTVKTSILQTAYRNLTTPIEQAPSQTLSFVQKMYMHWQHFAKNFYGHNANMDGKLDMKENLYHSKEVEKLFCNMCITSIHIHPPPLLRFQTVPEKVLTVKDFQIMNTLICQQNVLPPHQNIMINLTPLAPIMRYKSEMQFLCQLWNSTHCFATS